MSRKLVEGEEVARLRLVILHLGDQRLDSIEALLLADIGVERDFDLPAVEVAVEVEEMRLEQLLRRLEGRANAEAGDARMLASVRPASRARHRCRSVGADSRRARGWRSDSRARARACRRAGPRPRWRSRGSAGASRGRMSPAMSASRMRPEDTALAVDAAPAPPPRR